MKLFELGAKPSKQAAKVFESYFEDSINIDVISGKQAQAMLAKVRGLISEHRQTPAFHTSEQSPAYLKLVMMESVLAAKIKETSTVPVGAAAGAQQNVNKQQSTMAMPNPTVAAGQAAAKQQRQAQINTISDPKLKAVMQKANQGQQLNPQEQDILATKALTTESRKLRNMIHAVLTESEVQQAQVVLASQDMVDEIQSMIEKTTSMQFKDLPALVDQIKNQVGVDQAMQFNTDATAALAGLVQNLQAAKATMDQALGVVTGQAPQIPGEEMGGDLGGDDLGGIEELPPEGEDELEAALDAADAEEPEAPEGGGAGLGRARR